MMNENSYYKWNVKKGDYITDNSEYDKLYLKNRKREKIIRGVSWLGAASVSLLLFMKVLAYAAMK
ncbi:hypothetical protein MASR1M107_16580 [Ignavibacteriales bacterium]